VAVEFGCDRGERDGRVEGEAGGDQFAVIVTQHDACQAVGLQGSVSVYNPAFCRIVS
jgi:hypothetical protein